MDVDRYRLAPAAALAAVLACCALAGGVAADSRWLAALGHLIVAAHGIPRGVPFAAASTAHWPNPVVLAELTLYGFGRASGDRGLMIAQLLAVAGALLALDRDARAGGAVAERVAMALLLAAAGVLPSLALVRGQMFALVLFPLLLALLRAQQREPSRRIWLIVPLLALWANLHGTAVLGLLIALCYLACARRGAGKSVVLALAASGAVCATPAGVHTVSYYAGVLTNLAAQRGEGMWAPLSLASPADLLLIGCAAVLAARAWQARPATWEWLVAFALCLATVRASRDGVWLVLFLVPLAARAPRLRTAPARRPPALLLAGSLAASVVLLGFAVIRGPLGFAAAAPRTVAGAIALAHGSPVLAEPGIDEQVALAGGRIWAGEPIDAFPRRDQSAYLDFVDGRGSIDPAVRVVIVSRDGRSQRLVSHTPGFRPAGGDRATAIYVR